MVDELINLAGNERATPEARAAAEWGLRRIQRLAGAPLSAAAAPAAQHQAHRALVAADVERFLSRRDAATQRNRPQPPPVSAPSLIPPRP